MLTEVNYVDGGGGGGFEVTAFQTVAASAPYVEFTGLKGTPKKCIFVGSRNDNYVLDISANFNPTTDAIDGNVYKAYHTGSNAPTSWAVEGGITITINGNSAKMNTGNSQVYYWILLYTY